MEMENIPSMCIRVCISEGETVEVAAPVGCSQLAGFGKE